MSRRLSGSSSSHSFGGSSSGGSRSFGGASGRGTRKVSSSSSHSSSSSGSSATSDLSNLGAEVTIHFILIMWEVFGLPGLLIALTVIILIFLFTYSPIIGAIVLLGSIIGFTTFFLVRKKRKNKYSTTDILHKYINLKKYDQEIINSDEFKFYLYDNLEKRQLIDNKGYIKKEQIYYVTEMFDNLYEGFLNPGHWIKTINGYQCNHCHRIQPTETQYCGFCGYIMKGVTYECE